MKSKTGSTVLYILLPVIFAAAGYCLIFFGGSDIFRMAGDELNMAFQKGAPDYPNGFDSALYAKTKDNGNAENWSEVQFPSLDTVYARMSSKDLDISGDVFYGDSDDDFSKGLGQYAGSALFGCGKPILVGGHDTTYFAGLEKAKAGDKIEVQTNYGRYTYEVTETKVLKADDEKAVDLDSDDEELILYTCYPFGKVTSEREDRFFVYCKRTDTGGTVKLEDNNE